MLWAFQAAAHRGVRCATHRWQHDRGAAGRKTRSPPWEGTTPHGRRHPSSGLSPSFSGSARPPQRRPQGRPFPAIAGGSRWARGRAMAAGRCWLPALALVWGCAGMAAAVFTTVTPPVQGKDGRKAWGSRGARGFSSFLHPGAPSPSRSPPGCCPPPPRVGQHAPRGSGGARRCPAARGACGGIFSLFAFNRCDQKGTVLALN